MRQHSDHVVDDEVIDPGRPDREAPRAARVGAIRRISAQRGRTGCSHTAETLAQGVMPGEAEAGDMTTTPWRSLRPERPLPAGLTRTLEAEQQLVASGEAVVLRRKRALPTAAVLVLVGYFILVAAALSLVFFVRLAGLEWIRMGAILALATAVAVWVVRHMRAVKGDRSYLLLTHDHVAFVVEPGVVQWAHLDEIEVFSPHPGTAGYGGTYGTGGTDTPASLDIVFKDGNVEQLFVGAGFLSAELGRWAGLCNRALERRGAASPRRI